MHLSFLLSERNALYLINTASTIAFNVVICYAFILQFGIIGAAWARLCAEIFGFLSALLLTRWAFPILLPMQPIARVFAASTAMILMIEALDHALILSDMKALVVLIPTGVAGYLVLCWVLNVAQARTHAIHSLLIVRNAFARLRPRGVQS